jgi:hypothetical protein
MMVYNRTRAIDFMLDVAYTYAYSNLDIYGPHALNRGMNQVILASKVTHCVCRDPDLICLWEPTRALFNYLYNNQADIFGTGKLLSWPLHCLYC